MCWVAGPPSLRVARSRSQGCCTASTAYGCVSGCTSESYARGWKQLEEALSPPLALKVLRSCPGFRRRSCWTPRCSHRLIRRPCLDLAAAAGELVDPVAAVADDVAGDHHGGVVGPLGGHSGRGCTSLLSGAGRDACGARLAAAPRVPPRLRWSSTWSSRTAAAWVRGIRLAMVRTSEAGHWAGHWASQVMMRRS